MAQCPTTHGPYRCKLAVGHGGECESDGGLGKQGIVVTLDLDAQRELARAAARIKALETALEEIRTTPCEAAGDASCLCCLHDRMVATAALKGSS